MRAHSTSSGSTMSALAGSATLRFMPGQVPYVAFLRPQAAIPRSSRCDAAAANRADVPTIVLGGARSGMCRGLRIEPVPVSVLD